MPDAWDSGAGVGPGGLCSAATSAGPSSGVQTHASLPGMSDFGVGLGLAGPAAAAGPRRARSEPGAGVGACDGGSAGPGLGPRLGSGLASAGAGSNCLRALGGLMGSSGGGWGGGGGGVGGGGGEQRGSAPSPMALPPGSHFVMGSSGELGSPGLLLSQDLQVRPCWPACMRAPPACVRRGVKSRCVRCVLADAQG